MADVVLPQPPFWFMIAIVRNLGVLSSVKEDILKLTDGSPPLVRQTPNRWEAPPSIHFAKLVAIQISTKHLVSHRSLPQLRDDQIARTTRCYQLSGHIIENLEYQY